MTLPRDRPALSARTGRIATLREQYARGDLTDEEFETRRAWLLGGPDPGF